ncbi:MAG TPA: hypothetical protein DCQ04_10030 [Actinobacteria bacterium]|jgi:hypothetical protein|nr:hypothetical protein [Actinomycetota bacterium]
MNSVRVSSAGRLAIKITIASLITVGLSLYLGVTPANTSIALLTIIYTVGETFGSSLETGLNRAAGSVIGYGLGAIMVLLALPMWIAAPVAVGLTLFVCALLPMRLGYRLAAVLAGSIVLVPGDNLWHTVVQLVLSTFAGIIVALAVDYLVLPSHTGPRVRSLLADALDSCDRSVTSTFGVVGTGAGQTIDVHPEVLSKLVQANELITAIKYQPSLGPFETSAIYELVASVRSVNGTLDPLARAAIGANQVIGTGPSLPHLQSLAADLQTTFANVSAQLRGQPATQLPDITEAAEAIRDSVTFEGHSVRDVGRAFAFVFEVEVIFRHLQLIAVNLETERAREGHASVPVESTP